MGREQAWFNQGQPATHWQRAQNEVVFHIFIDIDTYKYIVIYIYIYIYSLEWYIIYLWYHTYIILIYIYIYITYHECPYLYRDLESYVSNISGKIISYFTNLKVSAIKGDDSAISKPWFQASGEQASVVIICPDGQASGPAASEASHLFCRAGPWYALITEGPWWFSRDNGV